MSILTFSDNSELSFTPTTPAAPTGLIITRFLSSYLLQWQDNTENDVYEYIVYRDGEKLPVTPRGGTFFVDVDVEGTHTYTVSAFTLDGNEGNQSASVSTNDAINGWGVIDITKPSVPTGLKIAP